MTSESPAMSTIRPVTDGQTTDVAWMPLFKIAGVAALAAALFAMTQITIEIIGVGVMGIAVPMDVNGWFALLESHKLLGLTALTMFEIPAFVLCVPVFLALYAALKRTSSALMLVATAFALLGITVFLGSNTVFSMLSLSDKFAAATTDAEKSMLLAGGQAMLALYEGIGVDVGVFLCMGAILMISVIMLQSALFSRATAFTGILAGVVALVYFISAALTSLAIFILEVSGLFFVIWLILVGRKLLRLGLG